MRVIGRLPGVATSQAQAAMQNLHQSYKEQRPDAADNTWPPYLVSAAEDVTGNLRPAFMTLLAAVSAVLLLACSNVANLLLVRFTGRKRELLLRMALGDRRGHCALFVFESNVSNDRWRSGCPRALTVPSCRASPAKHSARRRCHPVLAGAAFAIGLSLLTGCSWAHPRVASCGPSCRRIERRRTRTSGSRVSIVSGVGW
jgi:hypothetical protein